MWYMGLETHSVLKLSRCCVPHTEGCVIGLIIYISDTKCVKRCGKCLDISFFSLCNLIFSFLKLYFTANVCTLACNPFCSNWTATNGTMRSVICMDTGQYMYIFLLGKETTLKGQCHEILDPFPFSNNWSLVTSLNYFFQFR